MNYTKAHIDTVGSLQGIWGVDNSDAADLITNTDELDKRRRDCIAEQVGGTRYLRYSFIIRLNSGVIENHPLPKQVPIKLIFYRADAEKALLSLNLNETQTETAASYDLDRSIRLINPLLELVNTQSSELDKKYSQHRLSDLELPFLDKQIRNDYKAFIYLDESFKSNINNQITGENFYWKESTTSKLISRMVSYSVISTSMISAGPGILLSQCRNFAYCRWFWNSLT